jgi:hypothetical protein
MRENDSKIVLTGFLNQNFPTPPDEEGRKSLPERFNIGVVPLTTGTSTGGPYAELRAKQVEEAYRYLGWYQKGLIRVCLICGKWFVGRRKDQKYCGSEGCLKKADARLRNSKGRKRKWREYMREKMREYRRLEKRRDQINRRASHAKTA